MNDKYEAFASIYSFKLISFSLSLDLFCPMSATTLPDFIPCDYTSSRQVKEESDHSLNSQNWVLVLNTFVCCFSSSQGYFATVIVFY